MKNSYLNSAFLVLIILFGSAVARAQGFSYEPKGSFSVDIGIPTKEKNVSFNRVLEGLFNGGVAYQYNISKGFTIGLGAKYSFFINDRFALDNSVGRGGLHIPSVFLKMGYEKFATDRFSYSFSIRGGYSSLISVNDSSKTALGKPFSENTFFTEPQLELLMTTEKNNPNAFSLMLGYAIYFVEYRPEYLSRNKFKTLNTEDSEGVTRFFSFGFGYRYYFGMK